MTLCTIAIPVYNREKLIRQALESALAQNMAGLEILVVDNCSTDGTWAVLQTYHDPRLRLIKNDTNLGLFGNLNRCLELAGGKYLRLLCSDDRLVSGCICREVALMEKHPNVVMLSTRGRRVDENGNIFGLQGNHFKPGIYSGLSAIRSALWFQAFYAYNPFNYPSGVLLRREAALRAGRFDDTMRMSSDVDLFLRMLEHGDLAVSDALGCEITIHANQEGVYLTGDIAIMREILTITERYRSLLEEANLYKNVRVQLAAYALGVAFKYRRMGLKHAFNAHWDFAWQLGVSPLNLGLGVFRLLGLRLLMKTSGKRLMPDDTRLPLG